MSEIYRPKVGLALSGSGSRMVFYVGFLEELQRQNIHVDYIAAMSGASIVAAAYACGSLQKFKELVFSLNKKQVMDMLPKGKGGMYSLDKIEEWGRQEITGGKKMEEARPLLGFVASDIESGKEVVLSMGDIARAARVSCTLPFFFEPVRWGGKTLIDGGLLNVIPVNCVKDAGMDIIIGVNMRGTKHLFSPGQLAAKKTFNAFKKILMVKYLERVWDSFNFENGGEAESEDRNPQMFSVLGKSLDIALKASESDGEADLDCDLMITPQIQNFRLRNMESKRLELYKIGQQTAQIYGPKILEIIKSKQGLVREC